MAANLFQAQGDRVDILDGWRGIAIALVLLYHFFLPGGVSFGRMGVDIFFVLSGLLMSNILFIKETPLRTFYSRRISRIFPVLFIFVSLFYGLSYLLNLSEEHNNYIYTLLFLRSYISEEPSIWNTGIPVGHLWSLNVEEHCYILLSLLTLFLKKSIVYKGLLLIGMGVACILTTYYYIVIPSEEEPFFWHVRTEVVASHLLISAGYFLIRHKLRLKSHPALLVLVLFAAVACYVKSSPIHWSARWSLSPFLLAYLVNHLNELPRFLIVFLNTRILKTLGIWSYSIYLWQQPFYYYLAKGNNLFPLSNVLGLVLALAVGYASFRWLENPIRKKLNDSKWFKTPIIKVTKNEQNG